MRSIEETIDNASRKKITHRSLREESDLLIPKHSASVPDTLPSSQVVRLPPPSWVAKKPFITIQAGPNGLVCLFFLVKCHLTFFHPYQKKKMKTFGHLTKNPYLCSGIQPEDLSNTKLEIKC